MKQKKPMMKETVGAQYYSFCSQDENGNIDYSKYGDTIKTEVVKKIGTTENSETSTVRASGKDYASFNQSSSTELQVEVIAFPPDDLAKMRGDNIDESGLNSSGASSERPYFAYGKVVKKVGGGVRFDWYPKCQLTENTDDIETSEDTFSEQTDTVTIKAYPFDDKGNIKNYVDSEMENYPQNLTEEQFFTKPIVTKEDLTIAITPSV